jgi:hypothetical protein
MPAFLEVYKEPALLSNSCMQELCEIVVGSFLVAFTLTAGSSAAEAQQAGKIFLSWKRYSTRSRR